MNKTIEIRANSSGKRFFKVYVEKSNYSHGAIRKAWFAVNPDGTMKSMVMTREQAQKVFDRRLKDSH